MKKIAEGVAMLELTMNLGDRQMVIHPTLLWDDKDVILVDTGFLGMWPDIKAEMESVGVSFDRLNKVILTHQDFDHIGALPEILREAKHPIEVFAHELDQPYIQGDKPLIKFDPSRGEPPKAKVDTLIGDGEVLPQVGGITVVFTPGHTPGHTSLYHQASEVLITGDAITSQNGTLIGPNEAVTPDLPLAWQSIAKFANFDVKTAICYHGGICDENVNGQFAKLATKHHQI